MRSMWRHPRPRELGPLDEADATERVRPMRSRNECYAAALSSAVLAPRVPCAPHQFSSVEQTMSTFSSYTIETGPAASKPGLEDAKKTFGFVPNLQSHMAETPEL